MGVEFSQVAPFEESGAEKAGYYLLVIRLARSRTIQVGALGAISFRKGWYAYVGRAKRNLRQRVSRHLRKGKTLRWHIDYLLTHAGVKRAVTLPMGGPDECSIVKALAATPGAAIEPPRFGASDCRCEGHLVYFGDDFPEEIPSPLSILPWMIDLRNGPG